MLTFNLNGNYGFALNSTRGFGDEVIANRVTINNGAFFLFADNGNAALPIGTVFTMISNIAQTPIVGSFSNLADASTFTAGRNTY